jgi:hypothetical protein
MPPSQTRSTLLLLTALTYLTPSAAALDITLTEYQDRVRAAWLGQIAGTLLGFQFEHKTASFEWVDSVPQRFRGSIPVDDDWYYEMVAIRAFEKYGIRMTVAQLGEQWKRNAAGTWGSSEQARLLLARGLQPPDTGHPRYNRLWFSIGPQFSAEVYGMLAPGMPNVAARMAREYGHINGYAEGVDGAVFVAGMVSLAFVEKDPRAIVRKAARLIDPSSPYRQALDQAIAMAERGATAAQVAGAIEDRWHIEYPATNNAVANGALAAIAVWFGQGDLLRTINIAFSAADFTDADCNAANAAAVIGAMHGMRAIPQSIQDALGDRIQGDKLGHVTVTPPVNESLTELARRTAAIGVQIVNANGAATAAGRIRINPAQAEPVALPPESFRIDDLTQYWNPDWKLQRAGVGGAGGGMRGLRGNTYLDGDVLATYPRDEVRGLLLTREFTPTGASSVLTLDAGVDAGRAWQLDVFVGNQQVLTKLIEAKAAPTQARAWQTIRVPLDKWAGKPVTLRLYQRVLLGPEWASGNAYWRSLKVQ